MDDRLLERALLFAAGHFIGSCRNKGKPVFLHSLRVAKKADELGYGEKIVLAAILHDLLEDTDCTAREISEAFGGDMAALVQALTWDASIPDRLERSRRSIDTCARRGRDALVVKCLDAADNAAYFALADAETQAYLRQKYAYLLAVSGKHIADEPARALLETAAAQI